MKKYQVVESYERSFYGAKGKTSVHIENFLTLVVFDSEGKMEYIASCDDMLKAIEMIKNGADPANEWDGNELPHHVDVVKSDMENGLLEGTYEDNLTDYLKFVVYELPLSEIIADNDGIYYNLMEAAGHEVFGE